MIEKNIYSYLLLSERNSNNKYNPTYALVNDKAIISTAIKNGFKGFSSNAYRIFPFKAFDIKSAWILNYYDCIPLATINLN